jgi:hypothetical protein
MTPQLKTNADSTDVNITHDNLGWHGTKFEADFDDVSVSFWNKAARPCRITFHKENPTDGLTFGTPYIGLAANGVISLNILVRNSVTPYTVTELGISGDKAEDPSGSTIIIDT